MLLSDMYTGRTTALGKTDALYPHLFNLVMVIIEIILSRSLSMKFGIVYPIIALYIILINFRYLYQIYLIILHYGFHNDWPYFFLSIVFENGLYVFGFLVLMTLITFKFYYVSVGLMTIRDWAGLRFAKKRVEEVVV
jgi:hypothetical protein